MLCNSNMKIYFWAEAVNTACYTQNRSLIIKRHGKTLYELFHNKVQTIHYFHVFGSICYILNQRDTLAKMEPKSDEGLLVGYSSGSKAYIVFKNRRKKIEETLNVTFDESDAQSSEIFQFDINLLDELSTTDSVSKVSNVEDDQDDSACKDEYITTPTNHENETSTSTDSKSQSAQTELDSQSVETDSNVQSGD